MSFQAINVAFARIGQGGLRPSSALTLLALAHCHNHETGRCDPSVKRLMKKTGLSERGVRDALRQLEKVKAIQTIFRKATTGRGRKNLNNRYRILGGAKFAGGMGQNLPPNIEYNARAFDDLVFSISDDMLEGGE